jgi:hypothetical protein
MPIASAAAAAQAAFCALCWPRSEPMPPSFATSLLAPPAVRTMVPCSTWIPEASGFLTEIRTTFLPARSSRSAMSAAEAIVDADDRGAACLHAGDKALLHRSVMREGAVTVDVVLAYIEQDTDGGIERGREVDLVGRHLDDVDAARARRFQRQDRGADIAAHLGVVAGDLCEMRNQRGRGRLAVGAGDRDERRVGRVTATLAAEQLDIADHPRRPPRAPSARSSAARDG